jgi:hypothetical protein
MVIGQFGELANSVLQSEYLIISLGQIIAFLLEKEPLSPPRINTLSLLALPKDGVLLQLVAQ